VTVGVDSNEDDNIIKDFFGPDVDINKREEKVMEDEDVKEEEVMLV